MPRPSCRSAQEAASGAALMIMEMLDLKFRIKLSPGFNQSSKLNHRRSKTRAARDTAKKPQNNQRNCSEVREFLSGWRGFQQDASAQRVHKERPGERGLKDSEQNLATHHFKTAFALI